ncbi:MAG: beta-lactamase family protein [Bacteroidetes bacterium]|nr:beta-lactamase family protein [Bacteroidota bacterium]MBS1540434.1 beta-lactamase family protein [Bacteroidota bacterium]
MKNFYAPFLLIFLFSCQQSKKEIKIITADDHYQAPYFEDSLRAEKILAYKSVIDSVFKNYSRIKHNPSIAYGIVVDNKLIYSNATGYANLEKKFLADDKSRFRIASMTKSFTAMAILRLRDEGKLQLTDAAAYYIPEMEALSYPTKDGNPITIFNLLTMSAGFPEDNPWGDRQLSDTDDELMGFVKKGISFSTNPSSQFEYSNLGYALLGRIISNVSGQHYQDYIIEKILRPLGMNDCEFEYGKIPSEKLALGYRWEDNQWKPEPLLKDGSYASMGGMICTIDDFAKYMSFLLSASVVQNAAEVGPVKRSSAREMQQPWMFRGLYSNTKDGNGNICPRTTSYGFGLGWRNDCHGDIAVSHSGGLPGFGSVHILLPDYGIGVVAFSNLTYAGMGMPTSKVLDTLIILAELKKRIFPVSPILKKVQEQIMGMLPDWNNKFDSMFAENFFPDISKAHRKKETDELFSKIGKIVSIGKIKPENLLRGSFEIKGEKGAIEIFFTLTPEAEPKVQLLEFGLSQ